LNGISDDRKNRRKQTNQSKWTLAVSNGFAETIPIQSNLSKSGNVAHTQTQGIYRLDNKTYKTVGYNLK